jgi:hypothetical protein
MTAQSRTLIACAIAALATGCLATTRDQPTASPSAGTNLPTASPAPVTASPAHSTPEPTLAPTLAPSVAPTTVPAPPAFGAPTQISASDLADLRVAIDPAGAVHVIGTTEQKGRGLIHLTTASGVWTEDEVTTPPARGSDNGIVVATDTDGSLWVLFARYEVWNPCFFECRRPYSRLAGHYVINNASGAWSEPARVPEELGFEQVMAVRDGVLHLVYRLHGDIEVQIGFATNSGGEWQYELVGPGFWPDLALGSAGDPRVVMAVGDPGNYSITLALRSDDGWHVEAVPDSIGDPTSPHLAVNAADATVVQHAHFESNRGYASVLTTFDGTSWSAPVEIAPVGIDEMVLGPGDVVHVLFAVAETDSSDGLWWASLHGGLRVDQLIDPTMREVQDGPSAPQSFVLDAAGLPHIVFAIPYDEGREGVWYASGEAP